MKKVIIEIVIICFLIGFQNVAAIDGTCGLNVGYTFNDSSMIFTSTGSPAIWDPWDSNDYVNCSDVIRKKQAERPIYVITVADPIFVDHLDEAIKEKYQYADASFMFADIQASEMYLDNLIMSNVGIMSSMFERCINLEILSINSWDVSHVTEMNMMFMDCDSLKNLDLSRWNVSNVTNMARMFAFSEVLTSVEFSNWNTQKVTYMTGMFSGCSSLTNVNINGWNISGVKYMSSMFANCSSLPSLNVSNWDTSNVTYMESMFSGCNSLTNVDVRRWNTSNVMDMSSMFANCSSLPSLNVSNWDTSNVTDMESMFRGCSSLTDLDVSNWDTSEVANMGEMFYNCWLLSNLDVSRWRTSTLVRTGSMFYGCEVLSTLDVSSWDTSNIEIMSEMFASCKSLTSVDVSGWKTSKVRGMGGMFYECNALQTLDVSGWDTSNVGSMEAMFFGCETLSYLDVNGWDTSNVQRMDKMFCNCKALSHLEVNGWDTFNVQRMDDMFYECEALSYLDMSGWDTSKVSDMSGMFYLCVSLQNIDVGGWNTSKVIDMSDIFFRCESLKYLNLNGWNFSKVKNAFRALYGCKSLNMLTLGENPIIDDFFTSLPAYNDTWYYLAPDMSLTDPLPLKTTRENGTLFSGYDPKTMAGTWSLNDFMIGLFKSNVNERMVGMITILEYNDGNLIPADINCSDEYFLYLIPSESDKEASRTILLPDGLSFSNETYKKSTTVSNKGKEAVVIPIYSVYHKQTVNQITIAIKGDKDEEVNIPVVQGNGIVKIGLSFSDRGDVYEEDISNIGLDWQTVPKGHYDATEALMALHLSSVSMNNRTKDSLHNLGFTKINPYNNELKKFQTDPKGCAFFIAQKKVPVNGEIKTVIAVLIRGSYGIGEWLGNFSNLFSDEVYLENTFYTSAITILKTYRDYVKHNKIPESSVIRFVCGFSRGAAAAGILTHLMNEEFDSSRTVAYTYATPNNAIDYLSDNVDDNIFNYMYAHDIVPYVPQGDEKLGHTFVVGSGERPAQVAKIYLDYTLKDNKIPDNALLLELIINGNQDIIHIIKGISNAQNNDTISKNIIADVKSDLVETFTPMFGIPHSVENYLSWLKGNGLQNALDYKDNHNFAANIGTDLIGFIHDVKTVNHKIDINYYVFKWIAEMALNDAKDFIITMISCPVDLKIYDSDGIIVASIVDHQMEFVEDRDDFFAFTDGEKDYVYYPENSGYYIKITGNDDGKMNIETRRYDKELELADSYSFANEPVERNEQFRLTVVDEDLEQSALVSEGIFDPGSGTKVIITDQDVLTRTIDLGTTGEEWEKLTYQLGAVVRPLGKEQTVSWKSSDPTIAMVDSTGLVTALKTGTVSITATAQDGSNASASIPVNIVTNVQPGNLMISGVVPVGVGCSVSLESLIDQVVKPANQNLIWTSKDPTIVSVKNGQMTGIAAGHSLITVCPEESGKYCSYVEVDVLKKTTNLDILNKDGIKITGMTINVDDDFYQLQALPFPGSASSIFVWNSSDTDIAEVDEAGGVTFKKEGTVTITAETTDGSGKSASVELTYSDQPVCILGDLTGDGEVAMDDLIIMIHLLLEDPVDHVCSGDLDGDGTVGMSDLVIMIHLLLGDPV